MRSGELTIEALRERFNLVPFDEGGEICELFRDRPVEGRAGSGAIYYAIAPGQRSEFHVIDCDEYWLYHAGSTVEVWIIGKDGTLRVETLGLEDDAQPCVYLEQGEIFGARLVDGSDECAFMSCITAPRFAYEGYKQFTQDEMVRNYPEVAAFY